MQRFNMVEDTVIEEACGPTSIPHEVPSHKPQTNKSNTYETDSDSDNKDDNDDMSVIASEISLDNSKCCGDQALKDEIGRAHV